MNGTLRHIAPYPSTVKILCGAPQVLVTLRDKHGAKQAYQTNRDIKYWSTWFLLKSLTASSLIQNWTCQKQYLLQFLQMNENTLRAHLAWLKRQGLITIEKPSRTGRTGGISGKNLRLSSYEAAAEILGIEFQGVFAVAFNPLHKKIRDATQPFQYLLRAEEIEHHKRRQQDAIMYKLDKNPQLKADIIFQLIQYGASQALLFSDDTYFIGRLLQLQKTLFREGSDILSYIMSRRADVNRGVSKIAMHHRMRSPQSVSYFKGRMAALGLVTISKEIVESQSRSRLYIPAAADTPPAMVRDGRRDGYKYRKKAKTTLWVLCDQITRSYKSSQGQEQQKIKKHAA